MPAPAPSIGRVVHYQSYGTPGGEYLPEPRAAIITEVGAAQLHPGDELTEVVGLAILNPTGLHLNRGVPFAEEPTPGHWNWPPRV
ncbi:hypothetical protein [Rhodococcus opacus]|uniref:hypothetical protein n=1 Tax=Rhodococcus opacus TaxID=37919 RepID=UPI001C436D89|nr:hypothetical protein [Rhodococcus opacus]MBV6758383.1 hypothetical protein [Rhodococcus opacus]